MSFLIMAQVFSMSTAFATLTVTLPRGEQIVQRSQGEICVIPKKLEGGKYTDKDLKNEIALCQSDINAPAANVAACGKVTSTNPGVEFFTVPSGMTPAEVELKNCVISKALDPKGEFDKVAKYKNSTSCSYTPSIISYYHLSRFLGHVNQVPVAVLRTMDLQRHLQIGQKTVGLLKSQGKSGDIIGQTWGSLLMYLKQGSASKKKDALFTDDLKQSYGGLQKNPRGEEKYSEMFHGGANQQSRAINFRDRNPYYKLLKSPAKAASLVGTEFNQANVQKLVQLRNVADMVVMDTVLSQEDRFGNLHYTQVYYFNDNGELKKESKLSPEEIQTKKAILVKEMMMKDNDCGVNRLNHLKNARLLEGLNHMSPTTYHQLMKLNQMLGAEQTQSFFKRETMMSDTDLKNFRTNLAHAATVLKAACKAGRLQLDLDMEQHFLNRSANTACE